MNRATTLRERLAQGTPELIADLHLYSSEDGGKKLPLVLGYGCPCSIDKDVKEAWDGYPLVDIPMMPGERRRVGFVFLSGNKALEALSTADCLYLWEGKLIGEARIVR
ncbi:MAG: hypothetical protein B7Z39_01245 [Novosphingobium sp. 12-64-8]|nr:MAG: hypothetical protein B7Z39_01245 [Novosphingobium sp. 12-64-8]